MKGFIFGEGAQAPSYEALKKKRELADLLMRQSQGAPLPQNGWEGANLLAKTIAGKYLDKKLAPQEEAAQQQAAAEFERIRGGMGPEGITPDQMGDLGALRDNPYAGGSIEAVAKALMQRKMTPEQGGFTGGGLGELVAMSSKGGSPQGPDTGGAFGWTDPGEIPPEEPPPPADQAALMQRMSGTGQPLAPQQPGGPMTAEADTGTKSDAGSGKSPITREQQAKYIGFWNRMDGSEPRIQEMEKVLSDPVQRGKGSVPMIGNALVSEEFQQARRAADDWLMGLLRVDTGMTINNQELERMDKAYIPQSWDGPAVIKDKREARQRAMEGIKIGLGPAAILADELELQRKKNAPAASGGADGWRSKDPSTWTDEQLNEYLQ